MFANPLALTALSLLALPIIIHMLARLKGRRVLFPTTKYLRATESHRLKLRRIEGWPLLLTRLSACALLALAISDPLLLGKSGRPRAILFLIDSSLSMNAVATKEHARERASEAAASLSAGDIAAVAQFDASVKLLSDFTDDRDSLEKGIASYSPRYQTTDFSAAIRWANKKLASLPYRKEIILISDLRATSVYSSRPVRSSDIELRIIRVEGERRINARPGSIVTRAAGDLIEVESTALLSEGERTTITPVAFKFPRPDKQAGAIASDSIATLLARIEGDVVVGAVTANTADEFDADDSRFFVARLPRDEKILIVQPRLAAYEQAAFIDKAIRANSQAKIAARQTEKSDSLPVGAGELDRYAVVIAPAETLVKASIPAAREYVRRGGSLILTAGVGTGTAYEKLDDLSENATRISLNTIAPADSLALTPPLSPAGNTAAEDARSINAQDLSAFASVRFRAAHSVQANGGEVLLRYSNDQPAAVRISAGTGHVLILGFGLSDKDSTLARNPIYPVFIEWLASSASANGRSGQFIIGEAPTANLLRGLTRLTRLYSINGPALEAITDNQSALAEPGVYEAEYQSEKSYFALNISVAGSMLEQSTESQMLERVTIAEAFIEGGEAAQAKKGIGLWMFLAIGALVMTLIEMVFRSVPGEV